MLAPSHTWFQVMTAVPATRLSVTLCEAFVPSVSKRRGQIRPGPSPTGTTGASRCPIRIRAMPYRYCAKDPHGRAGAALSNAKGAPSVLFRLPFQRRRSAEHHESWPDMSAWGPYRRCRGASGASRAAPSGRRSSMSRSGCGAEVCQCSPRPCLVPVNDGCLCKSLA